MFVFFLFSGGVDPCWSPNAAHYSQACGRESTQVFRVT